MAGAMMCANAFHTAPGAQGRATALVGSMRRISRSKSSAVNGRPEKVAVVMGKHAGPFHVSIDVSELHSTSGLFGGIFVNDTKQGTAVMAFCSKLCAGQQLLKSELAYMFRMLFGLAIEMHKPCQVVPCMKEML